MLENSCRIDDLEAVYETERIPEMKALRGMENDVFCVEIGIVGNSS